METNFSYINEESTNFSIILSTILFMSPIRFCTDFTNILRISLHLFRPLSGIHKLLRDACYFLFWMWMCIIIWRFIFFTICFSFKLYFIVYFLLHKLFLKVLNYMSAFGFTFHVWILRKHQSSLKEYVSY